MAATKVSLKLLIDKKEHRVIFAEAGKEFVVLLITILGLPVGTVIRLLRSQGMVGCLQNLYESIENLSDRYLQPAQNKSTLLMPIVHINGGPLLLPNVESSTSWNLYSCNTSSNYSTSSNYNSKSYSYIKKSYLRSRQPLQSYSAKNENCNSYVSADSNAICPSCKLCMNQKLNFVEPPEANNHGSSSNEGGYVKGVVTYMVMDDLKVRPMSIISGITLLNKLVKEIGALEERVVHLGMDEVCRLSFIHCTFCTFNLKFKS